MIKVEGVAKSFRGQKVLDNVNMEVGDSSIVVVLGRSGAGKTVLLKIIAGLVQPDEGQVIYDGSLLRYGRFADNRAVLNKIGFVFQGGALFDWLSVADNIALPLREKTKMRTGEINRRVGEVLELVGMKGIERLRVKELSGGMVKLVAIARALVQKPRYLFLDEPTSGLDPVSRERVCWLIANEGRRDGRNSIVVTHDLESACFFTNRFYILKETQVFQSDDVKKEDYESEVA